MGTTTFYLRHNDVGKSLDRMTKEELEKLSKLSPYSKEPYYLGWKTHLELHNGNIYVLIFWKGKLMKLEEAPNILKNKFYNKYTGKTLSQYEWTILKSLILNEVAYLDKKFKSEIRKNLRRGKGKLSNNREKPKIKR